MQLSCNIGHEEQQKSPLLLRIALFAIMVLPSYMIIPAVGATGNIPHLLALLLLLLWALNSAFGLHNPWEWGHPGRMAMFIWIFASLLSYIAMFSGFSGTSSPASRAAADRWILLLLAGAGLMLTITEAVRTMQGFKSMVRWIMAGAFLCSVITFMQFLLKINPMDWISLMLVGFSDNGSSNAFQARDGLVRVAGTTMHPIELAAISAMILPLAIWWSIFDTTAKTRYRVSVPVLVFFANVLTVSRTGLIGLGLGILLFIPFLPRAARQWSLVIVPAGIVAVFSLVPGMVSTLFSSAVAGSQDSSITYRTDDYPLAWRLFILRPFLGTGPGNWVPDSMKDIFDNQYLQTATTLGSIGLAAFLYFLLVPMFASIGAAFHAQSAELKCLGGAVATALLIATVTSGTFDSMSFQTFSFMIPIFIGIGGFLWHKVREQGIDAALALQQCENSKLGGN